MLKHSLPYISIFKTTSGEEFIARVIEETMVSYTVEKPLCMIATQNGLQFAPFLIMADPEKAINIPKPIINATPAASLESQYETATSKIALPKKSAIIT
jgi:hypothetical protein